MQNVTETQQKPSRSQAKKEEIICYVKNVVKTTPLYYTHKL